MSCMTSKGDLRERIDYAVRNGWSWVPRFERVDAECPYCGVELAFEYDYEGIDETEEECPACGKTFDLIIEWSPIYRCYPREDGVNQ